MSVQDLLLMTGISFLIKVSNEREVIVYSVESHSVVNRNMTSMCINFFFFMSMTEMIELIPNTTCRFDLIYKNDTF